MEIEFYRLRSEICWNIKICTKVRPVVADLFLADGRNIQTDMTKVKATFSGFGNASKIATVIRKCFLSFVKNRWSHKHPLLLGLNIYLSGRSTFTMGYLLTHSMVQSPSWEANWFAASQEIHRILRNPKFHSRTHKRPPPVSVLGQTNPVHIPTSHLLEFHPNIIHPSTPRSRQWSLSLRFPQQDTIPPPLSSPISATCPAHLILLNFITRTILHTHFGILVKFV